MIKNRVTQLVYRTVYCTLAIVGFFASFGLFDGAFSKNFYVYYTNLSNYICMGVMFISLYRTIKQTNKNEEGGQNVSPKFMFMCVIMILVTFLVYNILLASQRGIVEYFTSISNLTLHVILPIMFILDWVLFYEHRSVKWYYPLLSTIMPFIYVIYILIRSAILSGVEGALLYPYFFLDLGTLGWGGFFMWIGILLVAFIVIGYLFYFFDNFKYKKKKED